MAGENTEDRYTQAFVRLMNSDMRSFAEESAKDPERTAQKERMFGNIMQKLHKDGKIQESGETKGSVRGQQAEERFADILKATGNKESEAEFY